MKEEAKEPSLRAKSISGAKWVGTQQLLTQLFQLVSLTILARLLGPGPFGVVAMAGIFTNIFAVLNEFGFNAAIIQQKSSQRFLSTAFWGSLVIGLAVFALSAAAAPLAVWFFKSAIVGPVLITLASTFVISSAGQVQTALLSKEMKFKQLAGINVPGVVGGGLFSIGAALLGMGIWSLVLGSVFRNLVVVVLIWRRLPWRPSLAFNWDDFWRLFSFGSKVTGGYLLNRVSANIDYLLIGRFLGPVPLGFYTLAFKLADFPRAQISPVLSSVAFPAFSQIQENSKQLARGYLKLVAYLSLVTFPLTAFLFAGATEFIGTVYGNRWLPAVIPLQFLLIKGALNSIGTTVGSVFLSKGRPDIQLKFQLAIVVFTAGALFAGVRFGINGAAFSLMVVTLVMHPLVQRTAMRLLGLRLINYLRAILPAGAISAVLILLIQGVGLVLRRGLGLQPPAVLLAYTICGLIAYLLILRSLRLPEAAEILAVVRASIQSAARKISAPFSPRPKTPPADRQAVE